MINEIYPIIFAAGNGTRINKLSNGLPKPLIEFNNGIKIIEFQIQFLRRIGFHEVGIFFSKNGNEFDKIRRKYKSREIKVKLLKTKPNGHGYAILQFKHTLSKYRTIFGLNGDLVINNKEADKWVNILRLFNSGFEGLASNYDLQFPKVLITNSDNDNLIGIDVNMGNTPYYYADFGKNVDGSTIRRNYIGMFLLNTASLKPIKFKEKDFIGLYGQGDLLDLLYKNNDEFAARMRDIRLSEYFRYYFAINTPGEFLSVSNYLDQLPRVYINA